MERFSLALDCLLGLLFLAFSVMLTVNTVRGEFQVQAVRRASNTN